MYCLCCFNHFYTSYLASLSAKATVKTVLTVICIKCKLVMSSAPSVNTVYITTPTADKLHYWLNSLLCEFSHNLLLYFINIKCSYKPLPSCLYYQYITLGK